MMPFYTSVRPDIHRLSLSLRLLGREWKSLLELCEEILSLRHQKKVARVTPVKRRTVPRASFWRANAGIARRSGAYTSIIIATCIA